VERGLEVADDYAIGIGTVGAGLWIGYGAGQKWRHIQHGPPVEGNCRALAVDARHPGEVWATADRVGVFRSGDNGSRWERVGPEIDRDIWSIGLDPDDDRRVYLGTAPGIFRSQDGGESFEPLDTSISAQCPIGVSRTTNVVVDPRDPSVVWASVEVDGLHRSTDRGDTWTSLGALGPAEFHNDVHGLATTPTTDGCDLLVTTPFGLGRSADQGQSFQWHEFAPFEGSKLGVAYSRCVRAPWDDVIVVCVGDYVPGRVGALEISRDAGSTWTREPLPVTPNSTMYWLATHPELPGTIVATSLFGQVYVSDDHAESWRKLDRELGEIRAVALLPAG
jgi:Sortilin, neurotensin receptor 3,